MPVTGCPQESVLALPKVGPHPRTVPPGEVAESGLSRRPRKSLVPRGARGFKSLPPRHILSVMSDTSPIQTKLVLLKGGCRVVSYARFGGDRGHVIADGDSWVLIFDGIVATRVTPSAMAVLKQLPNSPKDYEDPCSPAPPPER